jgi:hypothetical protein
MDLAIQLHQDAIEIVIDLVRGDEAALKVSVSFINL